MTLTDFLLARIAEDETVARTATTNPWSVSAAGVAVMADDGSGCAVEIVVVPDDFPDDPDVRHIARHDPARVLAECEAKRRIVEWHKNWPVLVERPPTFDRVVSDDPNSFAMRASQQIAWTTEQAYRDHFGTEPPTGPILRLLALPYADHPDYREEWKP